MTPDNLFKQRLFFGSGMYQITFMNLALDKHLGRCMVEYMLYKYLIKKGDV